ncbi:MAG TPA: flagellar filament capping protein FliD [Acidobacteriaceae bacterium]
MSTSSILGSVLAATNGTASSAIDVTSTVNDILYADRAPERSWQAQQTALAAQTSAISQLSSESSTLSDALAALQDQSGSLSAVTASSSNPSVVTASALAGTTIGNHTVEVDSLATTAAWYSSSVASSSTTLASGSFDLTVGSQSTTITIGSGVNTLDQVAASINSQSLGVNASVITDSSGSRLSLVAQSSGTAADFSVSTSGSSSSGLSFTQASPGADAVLKVDGVPITSASNTVTGAVSGLTFNLLGAARGTAVPITLTPNSDSITAAVSDFVSAFNTLIKDVNSQFSYNTATKTAGALAADSSINGLQSQLLTATNYASTSNTLASLTSLGISTNQDGTLTLDTTALANAATANASAVVNFFQGAASNGFAASLQSSLSAYTDPSNGAFTVDLTSISSENKDLTDQTTTLELYLATQQTALTAQYNAANIALTQLPQQIKQLDALLNPNSTNGN